MTKHCVTSITQNPPSDRRVEKLSPLQESFHQLELFPLPQKRRKPQISSIPGVSARERDRYRVMVGGRILGDHLSAPEALKLAKRLRKRKKFTESIELLESCGIRGEEAQIFILSEIGAMEMNLAPDEAPISLKNS